MIVMSNHPQSEKYHQFISPLSKDFYQEMVNCMTHGMGLLFSIIALILLLIKSVHQNDVWQIISYSIYGFTLIFLYFSSSLYHGLADPDIKRKFRILDHVAIYLLIAGSYTPLTLLAMRGTGGWILFGIVWGLAILGIIIQLFFFGKLKIVSLCLYMGMGWSVITTFKTLLNSIPPGMMRWIIAGGVSYTVGIIFYLASKIPFHHGIWHLFVLFGSFAHFMAFFLYLS